MEPAPPKVETRWVSKFLQGRKRRATLESLFCTGLVGAVQVAFTMASLRIDDLFGAGRGGLQAELGDKAYEYATASAILVGYVLGLVVVYRYFRRRLGEINDVDEDAAERWGWEVAAGAALLIGTFWVVSAVIGGLVALGVGLVQGSSDLSLNGLVSIFAIPLLLAVFAMGITRQVVAIMLRSSRPGLQRPQATPVPVPAGSPEAPSLPASFPRYGKIVLILIGVAVLVYMLATMLRNDWELGAAGMAGDSLAPFVGLASCGAVAAALWSVHLQRRSVELQVAELRLSRETASKQNDEQKALLDLQREQMHTDQTRELRVAYAEWIAAARSWLYARWLYAPHVEQGTRNEMDSDARSAELQTNAGAVKLALLEPNDLRRQSVAEISSVYWPIQERRASAVPIIHEVSIRTQALDALVAELQVVFGAVGAAVTHVTSTSAPATSVASTDDETG